jgi:hypothetical protein
LKFRAKLEDEDLAKHDNQHEDGENDSIDEEDDEEDTY